MAEKTIDIASPILSRNERLADQLRQRFNEAGTYVINVLSSPGSGKTTTILGTNERLRDKAHDSYKFPLLNGKADVLNCFCNIPTISVIFLDMIQFQNFFHCYHL